MNDEKTKAILFARKRLATEHLPKSIKIDDTAINIVPMLRDLGVTLDSSISFNQHVMNTCRSAFLELRCIGLIHKYLTDDAAKTIVCSLVLSRLVTSSCPSHPNVLFKNSREFKIQLHGLH